MSDKKKLIITLILLIGFIALSVFFWLITKRCWCFFVPAIVLGAIESAICYIRRPKEQPPLPTPPEYTIIRSISDITLKDFISAWSDDKLSVLGDAPDDMLRDAFNDLISQYYTARKDPNTQQYIKMLREIKAIELRMASTKALSAMMLNMYSPQGAEWLNRLYPHYYFTRDSYKADLDMVAKASIADERKYERLCRQLSDMQKETTKTTTPEQRREAFVYRLAEINKHEGIGYNEADITVFKYAILENRLDAYYKHLKEQANG